MYLKKIILKNIKCFSHLELDFTLDSDPRLWTAILGQNGLGKSTLLQAIGAVLAGPGAMRELLPVAEGWVRSGSPYGEIEAELLWTAGDAQTPRWPKQKTPYIARYIVTGDDPEKLPASLAEKYTVPVLVDWSGEGTPRERENISKDMSRLKLTAYAEGKLGWFACGYGPFRRLSGGAPEADRILYSGRKSARFVTLFREDAALTDATNWLISLYNKGRDNDIASKRTLEQVRKAFAQDLLPQPAELLVNAHSALLKSGNSAPIPFHDLSDGYRSMLALGIDMLRWLAFTFPESENFMDNPGVVLVDELDAHAHPAWQRQIGYWLRRKFPKIQFIVATHSPFLAQVTDEPGGYVVLQQTGEEVHIRGQGEAVDTWHADQIFTELFDLPTTRSPETEQKIQRLQELLQKDPLFSAKERQEYEQLRLWSEQLSPTIADPTERRIARMLQTIVNGLDHSLRDLE